MKLLDQTYNSLAVVRLAYLLALFQLQDGFTTWLGVTRFGVAAEGNPLIVFLLNSIGTQWGLILPKTLGIFLIFIMYRLGKAQPKLLVPILVFLNLLYFYAALTWLLVL